MQREVLEITMPYLFREKELMCSRILKLTCKVPYLNITLRKCDLRAVDSNSARNLTNLKEN